MNTMKKKFSSIQFSPLTDRVIRGNMRDDSADIFFQAFLHEALVSSSGLGRDVLSSMLSTQLFFCRPWLHPPSNVLCPERWF